MIGQMQGRFQLEVVPDVGHLLHEVGRGGLLGALSMVLGWVG